MTRRAAFLVPLLALVLALAAAAGRATTKPGVVYEVKVIVTDKAITIARDRFTRGSLYRYPRGAQIRYHVYNRGTRPYAFRIWGAATPPIRPGRQGNIFVNWIVRGLFEYETTIGGKPAGPRGRIAIF